jgi:PPOX class probable F420-dependent enzyme
MKRRLVRAMHRFLGRITNRGASDVAGGRAGGSVGSLDGSYCLVVSYRRDGTAVATPVWFGVEDDRVYFRAEAGSGKLARIRRNPAVRIAPCDGRGRPTAPPFDAVARVLPPTDEARAERAIQANYGIARRVYERLFTLAGGGYVEVEPSAVAAQDAS